MVLAEAYRIRELIGSGGMGQVYEADDVVLNRRVAIKVPWPASDPSLVKWEAQALAAIHHPALPAVYAVGRHGTIPFVVMERIYGRTLRDHLDQCRRHGERFSLEEALNVMTQLAEALAAVHRSGIAHRDIKPGNVVLAPGNRVVILDFGLVLPEFAARGELAVAGSPAYMAPEAIRVEIEAGRAHLVDIYALGVLSYELLTGDKPFQAEPTATATMSHHLVTPVPDLGSKSPAVPRDVALLVHSMLSKDPAERPPSAEHLARELHRVRFGAPHAPGSRRLSVLIAEDDANISSLLALWVRKAAPDADIRAVSDGESALSAVRASPPDLMLLDLNMPRMNGVEVCMYLRGTRAAEGLTIVSVSASAQEHDLALLRTLGVANFVAKGKGMGTAIARVVERIRPGRAEGGAQRRK
jgi:serine/threonine-protein kinase